jgi:hypothetical protein
MAIEFFLLVDIQVIAEVNFEEKFILILLLHKVSLEDVHDGEFLRLDASAVLLSLLLELDDRAVGDEVRLVDFGFQDLLFNL